MSSLLVDHSIFAIGPDRESKTRSTCGGSDKHEQIETELNFRGENYFNFCFLKFFHIIFSKHFFSQIVKIFLIISYILKIFPIV